jgi:hypothetical protein
MSAIRGDGRGVSNWTGSLFILFLTRFDPTEKNLCFGQDEMCLKV